MTEIKKVARGDTLMATAAQNVICRPHAKSPSPDIWHIRAGVSVKRLAKDIAHSELLQSQNARPVLHEAEAETGKPKILAGGRRFQPQSRLVKEKRRVKAAPIPCIERDAGPAILAEDDPRAEDMPRVALCPLDQFRALSTRRETCRGGFIVTLQVVR